MKKISVYFISLICLVMTLGDSISLFAAEETSSMTCDGGVVNIGDTNFDVREKCGEPNTKGAEQWVYDFGPSESYTVIFKDGKIVRIMVSR